MPRTRVRISRTVRIPDALRVARSQRTPELGPYITFLCGGTALRPLSQRLKLLTHNSTHLITPFDSGGSSGVLRRAFNMLSVGDLRNRLVALADETVKGSPAIYQLFAHRFPTEARQDALVRELVQMVEASHPLLLAIDEPMRQLLRTHLRVLSDHLPAHFDLRGANIGNLALTGGYLNHGRDIESALFLHSKLLEVRGTVRPTLSGSYHLRGHLQDGTQIVGQHLLTGKEVAPIGCALVDLDLVADLESERPVTPRADARVLSLIERSDLIVFPMGSFFTSVLANLLPRGVGEAIVTTDCPKLYIPNTGADPEQLGYSLADTTELLLGFIQRDSDVQVPVPKMLSAVLVDSANLQYAAALDLERIRELGIDVIDTQLVTEQSSPRVDPQRLAEVLISLSQ